MFTCIARGAGRQGGSILLETAVALLIFSLVGTAVLSGLSAAAVSTRMTGAQGVVENIARNQMEYMFSLPYQAPPSFYPAVSVPPGYAVSCEAEEYVAGNPNIERVVVTVTEDGIERLVLTTLRGS